MGGACGVIIVFENTSVALLAIVVAVSNGTVCVSLSDCVCVSLCLRVSLRLCLCVFVCLSVCLSVYLSVCLGGGLLYVGRGVHEHVISNMGVYSLTSMTSGHCTVNSLHHRKPL